MEISKQKYLEHLTKVKAVSREYINTVTGRLNKLTEYFKAQGIDDAALVAREDIVKYQDYVMAKDITVLTKRDELMAIALFFRFLHDYEYIKENPALVIDVPKKPFHLPRDILGEHEIAYLLHLPDQHDLIGVRDFCIMSLLYSSMMRPKEIFNLKVNDLNLNDKQALVRRPKNRRDRIVHIDGYTTFFLRNYLKNIRPWLLKGNPSENVFISATGSDFKAPSFAAHFGQKYRPKVREKFNKDVSPYVFRHSSATHWLDAGARKKRDILAYVQRQLGHESLESTAIYTHVAIEPLREMFKKYHPRDLQHKAVHSIPSPQELIDFWDKHKEDLPPEWPFR